MKELEFMKIPPALLFKVILRGCFSLFVPIGLLVSLLVLAGVQSVQFNERPTYGVLGFFISLIINVGLVPIAVTVMSWVILSLGFWIHIKYYNLKEGFLEKRRGVKGT